TTLVKSLASSEYRARYLNLDDFTVLAAARHDPAGFIAGLEANTILDEIQHAPELFPAIKAQVDRDRRPGRFLLTGSANVLLLPRLSESLAGRMEIVPLWPLSQGELEGVQEAFVDRLFSNRFPTDTIGPVDQRNLVERALRGGYPVAVLRRTRSRREAWFKSYLTTILQRDARDLANLEGLTALPRLLALLATRVGGLLNYSDVSRGLSIPNSTLKRYFALLEATFLVHTVPAWSTNLGQRLVKSPKLFLCDTGLMTHLLGLTAQRLRQQTTLRGPLMENFVAAELLKQITWSRTRPAMFHFRTVTGSEVDLVLENPAGRIVGIEIKTSSSIGKEDIRGLRILEEHAGDRFLRGIVLYTGSEVIAFGKKLLAVPIAALWTLAR
ncbi:MAG: ATP-binding protein, partial [Pirellulales bacterium]